MLAPPVPHLLRSLARAARQQAARRRTPRQPTARRHGVGRHAASPSARPGAGGDDRGQATAEYGLVILVAGGIALGVIAWAGGTGAFTDLFESVIDRLTNGL